MARKNLFLTLSLLVMVGALVLSILLSDPSLKPGPKPTPPKVVAAEPKDPAPVVVDATSRTELVENGTAVAGGRGQVEIRGRLVHADLTPAAGVTLAYRRFDTSPSAAAPDMTVRTDSAGRFSIRIAEVSGSVALAAESRLLFEMTRSRKLSLFGGQGATDLGDLRVLVASVIGGVVVDVAGQPIAGVTVESRSKGALLRASASVETGADGRFEFVVDPGVHRITTVSAEYSPASRSVDVGRGERSADLVLELERGALLTGLVVDDIGRPVEGAWIAAMRKRRIDPNTQVDSFDAKEAVATDAIGSFALGGVRAGDAVQLRAWAEGHVARVVAGDAAGGAMLRIELPRLGSIEGRLVDEAGQPIEGSEVRVVSSAREGIFAVDREVGANTDADGRFRVDGVEPGSVTVRATGSRHRPVSSEEVLVRSGEPTDVADLVVAIGATVSVAVLDAADQPVTGATVVVEEPARSGGGESDRARLIERRLTRGSGGGADVVVDSSRAATLGSAETDGEGRASIGGLPSGSVVLRARHPDHASARPVTLALPRSGIIEVQVTMRPGGFAAVRIVDASGRACGGAAFTLRGPLVAGETAEVVEHSVGSDGTARVGPLAAGSYSATLRAAPTRGGYAGESTFVQIGADDDEIASSRVEFTVVADQATEVELAFPITTTLVGRVTDAAGVVAGASVELRPAEEPMHGLSAKHAARTDADGGYSIAGVTAGSYVLSWGRPEAVVRHDTEVEFLPDQQRLTRDLVIGGGQLQVTVTSADGSGPIRGAAVTIERVGAGAAPERRAIMVMSVDVEADSGGGEQMMSMRVGGPGAVETDAGGVATMRDVPAGSYRLIVRHADYATERLAEVTVVDGRSHELPTVVMRPGGHLRGQVIGFPDDAQFKFATVELLRSGGGEPRSETAMNGVLEIDGLEPGSYSARARQVGPGAGDAWGPPVTVEIVAGEFARIEIPLR